ncbi:MAG: AraC family transcriptional regulator [Hyphomicrobium sp.]
MPGPPARIRAGILVELQAYCAANGLKLGPMIAAAGIDPVCLEDPNVLVPLNAACLLFDNVAHALEDPYFGITFASCFTPGASGMPGALIMSAPTVREALTQLARLVTSFSPQVVANFDEQGGVGHLKWIYPDTITAPRLHYVTFNVASIVMRVREGTGLEWRPLSVDFDHRAPPSLAPYVTVFGERLRFEMPVNQIAVDAQTLNRPMKSANPALFALAIDLAKRWIEADPEVPDVVRSVRAVIAAQLTHGTPTLEGVARNMGLTISQLQWRLDQAGSSFERVLNGMRADMAKHLLENTDKSITEIAFALGFSDPSTFSRAARRWFSDTPLKIRRKSRRGDPPNS